MGWKSSSPRLVAREVGSVRLPLGVVDTVVKAVIVRFGERVEAAKVIDKSKNMFYNRLGQTKKD
jgi:hypothetical protein